MCIVFIYTEGGIEGMLFEGNNQLGSPQLISTVILEDKPGEENEKTPIDEQVPSTSSPQIALEYNTLAPSNSGTNSDVNSQDAAVAATEIPVQTEIPNKQTEDSVGSNGENNVPVTTIENDEQLSENEKLDKTSEKPIENDSSENEKPAENVKLEDNGKPIENSQSAENEKPIDSSEADFTTVSYEDNSQTATNKPETSNNIEDHNTLPNSANESQDNAAPSTLTPNYEPTVANVLPTNDQQQPNSGSEDSITATTLRPSDSALDQQVDDNKSGANEPAVSEGSNASPVNYVTDLPEIIHIPTIVDDTKPTLVENNTNGIRPSSSIDDIISSVNMVKDAVKNSLETSSKPVENNYQTTEVIENYRPTIVPDGSASPPSENSSPNQYDEPPQTTVSSTNDISPELQTDVAKLTENPTTVPSSDESEGTQVLTSSPSAVSTDQGVPTDSPQYVAVKQEIPSSAGTSDVNGNETVGTVDDKTPEVATTNYSPSSTERDPTSHGPGTFSDSTVPQVVSESNTRLPESAVNDKSPETGKPVSTSVAHQEPVENDTANKNPVSPISDHNAGGDGSAPTEVAPAQVVTGQSPSIGNNEPGSSSPAPSSPEDDNKLPQESGGSVNTPFEEPPSSKPTASVPATGPPHGNKPSYTPIPQSTWTQKPFHHDSTSEAPQQPDQSFPDEYDDENEAVYGPGTCR